jgi:serine/threonine protein phosphatase 1
MIYAVGDIHGQLTMLQQMLEALRKQPLNAGDTVVFLGDYIDRGKDSRGVIDALLAFQAEHANCVFLRGNHEQLILDAFNEDPPESAGRAGYMLYGERTLLWLQNGGTETLDSYSIEDYTEWVEGIPEAHWQFVRDTQQEYKTEDYHFVHAGLLPPGMGWDGQSMNLDPHLWIRDPFLTSAADFEGRIVVFGHTPQMSGKPLVQPNKIGIDTAAVFGKRLTAAIIDPAKNPIAASVSFLHIPYA